MATLINIPRTLTTELVERLARLWGQPEGVAEVALSVLSYGSRASLIEHGVIEPIPTVGDDAVDVVITDCGRELIEACADRLRSDESHEQLDARQRLGCTNTARPSVGAENVPELPNMNHGLIMRP